MQLIDVIVKYEAICVKLYCRRKYERKWFRACCVKLYFKALSRAIELNRCFYWIACVKLYCLSTWTLKRNNKV